MSVLKYKDSSGNWKEVGLNTEGSGGGTKLYAHNISFALSEDSNSAPTSIINQIITHTKQTELTPDDIYEYFIGSSSERQPLQTAWGYGGYLGSTTPKTQYTPINLNFGKRSIDGVTSLLLFVQFSDNTSFTYGSSIDSSQTKKYVMFDFVTEL